MIKALLGCWLIMCMPWVFAKELIGWHWYNEAHIKQQLDSQQLQATFAQLSPVAQLKVLQQATNSLRDKAILSGKVSDITAYKQAQDFWMQKATAFTMGWEQMLLAHPKLDYSLQYTHENALLPIKQQKLPT